MTSAAKIPIEKAPLKPLVQAILVEKPDRSRPPRVAEGLDVRGRAGNL
jgi:hypothetical protein